MSVHPAPPDPADRLPTEAARVAVLCQPDIATGFALAGLRAEAVADGAAARARLLALVGDPAVGLVLVDDRLQRAWPAEWLQRLERPGRPLVVAFPGPPVAAEAAAEAAVLEILRRAIGYRVRLP